MVSVLPDLGLAKVRRCERLTGESVSPAVGGFVQAYPFQLEVIAIAIPIKRVEDGEGNGGKIFCGGDYVEQHGLVAGNAGQEVHDLSIVFPGEEGMVPLVHHMGFGDGFDVAEVHQHAVGGGAIVPYHVAP